MANIRSQIKRNRQTVKRHARNQAVRSELKTRFKATMETTAAGDPAATEQAFRAAQKRIDTAVSKGIVHKRTASRRKSRLARRINTSA